MTKYDDVKNISTEDYFLGNQFSVDAFNKKYAQTKSDGKKETYIEAIKRVCDYVSSAEKTPELQKKWSDIWFDEIYNDWWHPAGSIMQGAKHPNKISMMNCTTIEMPEDSLEAIFRYNAYHVAKMAAYRQGLGVNYDRLRPRGMALSNSAVISEGSVHWMGFIDSIGYKIGQKGRIPAMLFSLSISHPDVEEFITVKSDYTKIQNANISIQMSNKFYEAVQENEDWELKYTVNEIKKGDKLYLNPVYDDIRLKDGEDEKGCYKLAKFNRKKEVFSKLIKSTELLELIAKNMFENAEPGIQNIDIARKYSNSDAVGFPIIGTNACSEQYLDSDGNCNLASHNCEKYFDKDKKYNKELLKEKTRSIVRFLDDVITMELNDSRYATFEQRRSLESLRRIGMGVTNIVGLLFLNNKSYGSKDGNELIETFIDDLNYYGYQYSIELGKEKGSFLAFDKDKYMKSGFIKQLVKRHSDLIFDTMRNVCITSIAPTGTLSLMFRLLVMSYGIEPGFGLWYWKRTRISGKYEYYFNVPNAVRVFFKNAGYEIPMKSDTIKDTWSGKFGNPIVEYIKSHLKDIGIDFKSATDITVDEKLDLMAKVQKNIDSSISVTYMLPESSTWKDAYNLIVSAHKKEVKSIAAFPDKKMYGIISFTSFKELAFKLKSENVQMHAQNFTEDELKELNITESIKSDNLNAPKRPKELPADIYSIKVKDEKFCVVVGMLNDKPYELFAGTMNGLNFKFQHKKGKMVKMGKGKYKLEIGEDISIEDFQEQFKFQEQLHSRLISLELRHGIPIKFLVEQLQKSSDDMFSLPVALARVLKKYIVVGEKVTGHICPTCGSELIYDNGGCWSCSNGTCDWSKCN